MAPKLRAEKWTCSYLANETDVDFRKCHLKPISRPDASAGCDDVWSRLYSRPTVSTILRMYGERPHIDSFQLWLDSTCDQLMDYPISKQAAVRQLCTREKRCFCKPVPKIVERQFNHPLRIAPLCETPTNINYIKLAIECPHISQTNNGYARKDENGNFYRS